MGKSPCAYAANSSEVDGPGTPDMSGHGVHVSAAGVSVSSWLHALGF